jgi:hypothetical protein
LDDGPHVGNRTNHKWAFQAVLPGASIPAGLLSAGIERLEQDVSEIRSVAQRDPILAADGAVSLMERIWPAFEHIDTSSGALGGAVYCTLSEMIAVIAAPPEPRRKRKRAAAGWIACGRPFMTTA